METVNNCSLCFERNAAKVPSQMTLCYIKHEVPSLHKYITILCVLVPPPPILVVPNIPSLLHWYKPQLCFEFYS